MLLPMFGSDLDLLAASLLALGLRLVLHQLACVKSAMLVAPALLLAIPSTILTTLGVLSRIHGLRVRVVALFGLRIAALALGCAVNLALDLPASSKTCMVGGALRGCCFSRFLFCIGGRGRSSTRFFPLPKR